jgi:proteasome accessory factor C
MDKFDRIFGLHAALAGRRTGLSLEELMARLECSKSTLHRAVNTLRDSLGAPIVFDSDAGGYKYDQKGSEKPYELPGLWFSAAELQALAVMQRLLRDAGGGILEDHLSLLARRLESMTKHQQLNLGEAAARLRFPAVAARPAGKQFETVCAATLQRRKLWIEYHARTTDQRSERTVSPQRVTHYRESWYLDAWDDGRDVLRTFSIDRITRATLLDEPAFDVPDEQMDEHYASAYGIFGGKADKTAVLLFTAQAARWVADEKWHPQQQFTWFQDGRYELRVPYAEARELMMDVMRQGGNVEVISPAELREQVRNELQKALDQYGS